MHVTTQEQLSGFPQNLLLWSFSGIYERSIKIFYDYYFNLFQVKMKFMIKRTEEYIHMY
jgi:hypothetical protein